ncbi:DDB1- and CUL4-associated factor 15 isoform X1 [Scleropages formosus]|uniref:DDB1 and CUL4 associated factor 15 n=1 Tax=Scleropages formosus TaxID=113540 RepID=A0A8C9S5U7_SCLFO|nr:DDB1- and CUL4-associated factor 15 isoform X1 [Scleropages formosus]
MAPSSKSEKDENKQKKHREHIVKLLNRGKLSGQVSQRLFRKLPPRVCVPLKTIVSEEFLRAGHIFLGFTKCGRYVLSYTSDCGEDDDFSFYIYHLYWWEFNLHSRLRQVHHVRLFAGEDIYSDLYLTVCEWPNDHSKVIVFGFNTRSSSSVLMNLVMSDENNRDIYITIASMPPLRPCSQCSAPPTLSSGRAGAAECLEHGYVLNSRYQVVYPFPTFQPAFQLKKDQVVLLNTSYSLVACAVSFCPEGGQEQTDQILYKKRASCSGTPPTGPVFPAASSPTSSQGSPDSRPCHTRRSPASPCSDQSQAAARAREFAADLFRRAQTREGRQHEGRVADEQSEGEDARQELHVAPVVDSCGGGSDEDPASQEGREERREKLNSTPHDSSDTRRRRPSSASSHCGGQTDSGEQSAVASTSSMSSSSPQSIPSQEHVSSEPGYINYTCHKYCLQQPGAQEQDSEYEDDKVHLPFTVTDLKGRSLQLMTGRQQSQQCVCVEQLTLDFEYVINEVIRNDASWAPQFCSFSDYDVVILEVCPETNTVVINIGLLLLAFSTSEEEHSRPNTYHTSVQVSWDLSTGVCHTVGIGDLMEVKGQTSGAVWSSYRKSCVNTVMKWLVPESSSRYINRMTNEALHKGSSLQVLADSDRGTWIVL